MSTNAFPVDVTTTTTPLTTKGDILSSDGTSAIRLPVGTDGQGLFYSSANSTGLSWASLGAANYYEHISSETITASGSISSVTFSSIASTYKHLEVRVYINATRGLMFLRMNSDTTASNYYSIYHTLSHPTNISTTGDFGFGYDTAEAGVYLLATASNSGTNFQGFKLTLPDYANTTRWKQVARTAAILNGGANQGDIYVMETNARWKSTSAITSLTFTPGTGYTFNDGTVFSLYGVKS